MKKSKNTNMVEILSPATRSQDDNWINTNANLDPPVKPEDDSNTNMNEILKQVQDDN